mgnify:CR=1 FL=1
MSRNDIPRISMIIPVYNVRECLDECMTSVVDQTFQDFEIILIDDGSTDGSAEKCDEWAKRDGRVVCVHKRNEGLSKTRNLGLHMAKGEYVSFVDSDDWLDTTFLEKLYNMARMNSADIAECDFYRYNDKTGEKTVRPCGGCMGVSYSREEYLVYGNTAIWKCLIRKDLMESNGIEFPDCHSPARAVYGLMAVLANKIVNVREPLYYYRRFRSDSLTEKPQIRSDKDSIMGIQAMRILLDNFKKRGLYTQYASWLERAVKYKLSDLLAATFTRRDREEYSAYYKAYHFFLEQSFPGSGNDVYVNLGGYNLNRIVWNMNLLHNPYCRFNFSSIISIMHPASEQTGCRHRNKYREVMLRRDLQSSFFAVLEEMRPRYLIMDFLEERFDIVQLADGGYITKSDAYEGGELDIDIERIISRFSPVCQDLWQSSCRAFIKKLRQYIEPGNIILVRNHLSEKVGDLERQVYYDNLEEIQSVNRLLDTYYDYFCEQCPETQKIETRGRIRYFTDQMYEYGAVPPHLNDLANREIAEEIENIIVK